MECSRGKPLDSTGRTLGLWELRLKTTDLRAKIALHKSVFIGTHRLLHALLSYLENIRIFFGNLIKLCVDLI